MADQDADIRTLARSGRKIEAIRLYRERYRVGLADAKEAVEAIAEGRTPTPGAVVPGLPNEEAAIALPTAEFAEIIDGLVKAGQKIQAIKLYRARYGLGLKEAKDVVDEWERRGPIAAAMPTSAPATPVAPRNDFGSSIDALAQRDDEIRAQPDEAFAAAIDAQVRAGHKLEAMRLYRIRYPVALKEAKDAIDGWEHGLRVLPPRTVAAPAPSPRLVAEPNVPTARMAGNSTAEPCEGHIDERNLGQGIDLALRMGRHEEAIQLYQERAGVSRREAEQTIAARERQLGGTAGVKSGCFIATAAFGSEYAPEVTALRRFRDAVLAQSSAGRSFILWYYRWSPPLAERMVHYPQLCALVRVALRPVSELALRLHNRCLGTDR